VQAAKIAREVGGPVKLIWSREEDVRHDHYRPAVASRFRAAVDQNGQIAAWENVYHEKHEPVEAPTIPYAVAAQKIHHVDSPTHVPFGPWRSVDHSQHGFFTEAFFDEVAVAAGKDPYEYRMSLLTDKPRHQKVLRTAAEAAGWGEQLPRGRGRGISLQESFGSLVAQVVDVSVTEGKVSVDRVVVAVDAGFAVSPDGLTAQMESGVNYGLTAALYGEINIENGAVKQSNFHDYLMVRMNESPLIETHIINSGESWGGAGEPGTPGIAPALVNAVFDATGLRVRELPLSKQDFSDFA
ncbi:molybdopterin cofactor-binding domain-containing protein, partial [Congregibacter sp.]|uniref:molybdopterin cofactor-binding domain-containing protein n=1 Tax=Congregibacter sp. TaxID=2744308 RepID=UPI0038584967